MVKNKKNITKRILSLAIKFSIVAIAAWFIYKEVFENKDIWEIKDFFISALQSTTNFQLLVVVLLLMFVNWGIEALKWQFLIKKIEKIGYSRSLKAVFSGITVSVFTPNRIGEFAGRVFFLKNADRFKAALITIVGSISQLLVTVIAGVVSFLIFIFYYSTAHSFSPSLIYLFTFISSIAVVLFAFLYLNSGLLTILINKIPFLRKYGKYSEVFSYYSTTDLLKVLLFSVLRYFVFSIQYYLLLKLFDVNIGITDAFVLISLTFFSITAIPTIALTEIGVREVVALQFIGIVSMNEIGIVSGSFTLWLINLAIPAIIGSVFVFGLKFFRKKN